MSSDGTSSPYKRGAAGSNPAAPTVFEGLKAEVLRIPVNRRAELFRICSLVVALPDEIVPSASRSGDELLAAVDVVGGAGQGRVDHDVDCEGSHVGRPDHAADRERGAELSPAHLEVVAEQ
jgi:hypothetical protein